MADRTSLTAWCASRVRRERAPLVPPPRIASAQEPRVSEEVDGPDGAIGSGPDSDEWAPAETAVAAVPVGGGVHDIAVSPDGEYVYVARSGPGLRIEAR